MKFFRKQNLFVKIMIILALILLVFDIILIIIWLKTPHPIAPKTTSLHHLQRYLHLT